MEYVSLSKNIKWSVIVIITKLTGILEVYIDALNSPEGIPKIASLDVIISSLL